MLMVCNCIHFIFLTAGKMSSGKKERGMKHTTKVFGIIAVVALIGFYFTSCGSNGNGGGNGGPIVMKISGIDGIYNDLEAVLSMGTNLAGYPVAFADAMVSDYSATFYMEVFGQGGPFSTTGQYYLVITFISEDDPPSFYRTIHRVNISGGAQSVSFNYFVPFGL